MQPCHLERTRNEGAVARRTNLPFHSNPHLLANSTVATIEETLAWNAVVCAWASGWIQEDRGRDQEVARLAEIAYW